MKKLIGGLVILLAVDMVVSSAWARRGGGGGNNPCSAVYKACVSAGKQGSEARQCVDTIKGGGTVEGVTVSTSDVQACQAAAPPQGQPPSNSSNGNG